MADDMSKELTAQDMFKMIDKEVGEQITTLIQLKTESPFHAMVTLAAVMAGVIASIVEGEDAGNNNTDEMARFTKELISTLVRKRAEAMPTGTTQH
jgi:uncharacterized membrane protein (DUF106 family)